MTSLAFFGLLKAKMIKHLIVILLFIGLKNYASAQTIVASVLEKSNSKWTYVSPDSSFTINHSFDDCSAFSKEGYSIVVNNNRYFILRSDGKEKEITLEKVHPKVYPISGDMLSFKNGLLPMVKNYKWGYIDTTGHLAIDFKYNLVTEFNDGFASARLKQYYSYLILDQLGNEVPIEEALISDLRVFSEGLAPYEVDNEKYGFVDTLGNIIIEAQFHNVGEFHEGIAWVRKLDGIVGFINKLGQWVIRPSLYAARNFDLQSGLAMVKNYFDWGYIDTKGNFRAADKGDDLNEYFDGRALIKKNGKYGYIDKNKDLIIPPIYRAARHFKNGLAMVKQGKSWGLIDTQGNWVLQPNYWRIKNISIIDH